MPTTAGSKAKPRQTRAVVAPASPVFPIVGIGASAGGLEPFLRILRDLGERPGLAIVFILHQERHQDRLAEVVARATPLKVVQAAGGMRIAENHVYVAPSDAYVTMADEKFLLNERTAERQLPINIFFRSLAEVPESRAISIVLSGSASDGALGTKAIKAEGGVTFAQDDTASFPQMPRAAVATGSVDFVLPPEEIAQALLLLSRDAQKDEKRARLPDGELAPVFRLLHAVHDIDFTHYKPSTVQRRIRRRMALHKIDDLATYVAVLRDDPDELEQLCADILIRVTSFFRDPEVFDALKRDILPALMHERSNDTPLRFWVPGCATGEEVYSLAIAVLEVEQEQKISCPVQIFGTDVSESAVDRARLGIYPEVINAEVSPARLRRYFTRTEDGYRIAKAVRDCCVFARQNLTRDPPFSRLDMISCRNVMIYLGSVLQRKVMSIFHYALQPDGYLLLGSSETIGTFGELFGIVDRKHKIYQKKTVQNRLTVDFEPVAAGKERPEKGRMDEENVTTSTVFREADRVMLARLSPPGVLINEDMEVLQFRGRTSLVLEPPSGAASFNLLKMAREGLVADLRAAILAARKQDSPVRRENVRVGTNGGTTAVNIEVIPFVSVARERYQIILFEEVPSSGIADPKQAKKKTTKVAAKEAADNRHSARLRRELEATREYLQSIIEEQEAMNEELRSANEEIQSSNEELQSTNEELETAKEELQSSNEELSTLNEELENRNDELAQANNDLMNLLASLDVAVVMLDSHLRVRRFNPGAQRALNLIASDVGRPINDLRTTLMLENLDQLIATVIETLETREMEVQDRKGHWFSLRVRPYKTTENKIDGAVLVLVDIDAVKRKN